MVIEYALLYIISIIVIIYCGKHYPGLVNRKDEKECIELTVYSLIPIINFLMAVYCIGYIIFNTLLNYLRDDNKINS